MVDFYTSGDGGELVATLPVPKSPALADHRVIYTTLVPNIQTGDVLDIDGSFEATSALGFNVMLGSYLVLATDPAHVLGAPDSVDLSDPRTENFHRDREHHIDRIVVAKWQSGSDLGDRYVNLVGYAGSSSANGTQSLTVEPSYGRVNVIRFPV